MGHVRETTEPELSEVSGLRIWCDDCGHKAYWPQSRIRDALRRGFKTVPGLGSKFRCQPCVDRGGGGRNVTVRPVLKDPRNP